MIIHRMSTQAPEPPVKFYKGIALSFLLLTIALLGVVIFITSKKVSITVLTKQDPEVIIFNANVGNELKENAIVGKILTAPFYYQADFNPTGNTQVEDVAKGTVTIFNKTGSPQTLVKTTRLLSQDGVLFRLENQTAIPANGEVKAAVYADQKGIKNNIGPSKFTIPGLSTEKQKVIFAESKEAMSGGMKTLGSLGANDIENAKNEFKQKMQDEYVKTLSAPESGIERLVYVTNENISVSHTAGEVVTSFSVSGSSTVVVVEYKKDDLSKLINKEAAQKIDSKSERYLSLTNGPKITVQSYDQTEGLVVLGIRQEVAVTLDANSDKLSPDNFFGKKKEEIERYVMGLDHVAGVEVKFSPAWVNTAPASVDRISVLVKNIK
jgi:hypothetical protein